MKSYSIRQETGQTVIEMVVALGIFTTAFLGIVTLLNNSLGLNRVVADNYRATYLAAEGIEIIKSLVATNAEKKFEWCSGLLWGNYELDYRLRVPVAGSDDCTTAYTEAYADMAFLALTTSTNPLLYHPSTHLYDYDETGGVSSFIRTPFYRTVSVSPSTTFNGTDDMMIVQSVVRWKDKTGDNEVNLIDYLYNPSSTPP
jgi:hypothetical protein